MNSYNVNKIENSSLEITGEGESALWNEAHILTNFISAWDKELPKKIEFRALHNTDNLYFQFKVYDNQVHIDTTDDTNASINESDRVELFFRTNESLDPYYCLEIDPTPRIMDFKAKPNRDFDFGWKWPNNGLKVKSNIDKDYFVVEGTISKESLEQLKLIKNNRIETGIYRANYNKVNDTDYEPTWISWVNPNTPTPNFHTPTSFGILNLIE
jgi:hypothetical protein